MRKVKFGKNSTDNRTLLAVSKNSDSTIRLYWVDPNYEVVGEEVITLDCPSDVSSTGVEIPDAGQCQCLVHHYWDSESSQCKPHCNRNLAVSVN